MNTPLDRDALARRVFDAVICHPNISPIDALGDWLRLVAGIGGYLCCSSPALDSGLIPLPGHLYAIGDATERAAKIAIVLADEVESELMRLSDLVKGQDKEGAA